MSDASEETTNELKQAKHADMIGIWSGVAAQYDAYRPRPPHIIPNLLAQLARVERPHLVVDLGSGTGLSTFIWADRAGEVVGVEPNDDMRHVAAANVLQLSAANVRFVAAVSSATGLPDSSVDIVTASQSLHWMDPQPTFAEIARILRPGGVFAAYDYDWPPLVRWELDQAYQNFHERVHEAIAGAGLDEAVPWFQTAKSEHLKRMCESGQFRYTREIALHSVEEGDADRFIGISLTNSADIYIARGLLRPEQVDLDAFREAVRVAYGDAPAWYLSYHLRMGVKEPMPPSR
jgi:ubiquinone/menaquinone biosynthesis C-methylase UbiE